MKATVSAMWCRVSTARVWALRLQKEFRNKPPLLKGLVQAEAPSNRRKASVKYCATTVSSSYRFLQETFSNGLPHRSISQHWQHLLLSRVFPRLSLAFAQRRDGKLSPAHTFGMNLLRSFSSFSETFVTSYLAIRRQNTVIFIPRVFVIFLYLFIAYDRSIAASKASSSQSAI